MFGERVRELREKTGMTQEKLAQAADLTTFFVSTGELLSGFSFDALRRMKL